MKGKGMAYDEETMKGKKMAKQMPPDGEENGEEEEDEEEETEKGKGSMCKSELTTDDLQKSLDKLEQVAATDDPPSRREALLASASDRELSKSEREELFELLGGESTTTATDDDVGDEIVKSMQGNEELAKALDVSDYLQEQHTELVKSLHVVGEKIRESDNRHHEFGLVMARAVHDIGTMVKSLAEQIETLGAAPARAPKSMGVRAQPQQVMQKSFAGGPSGEEQLAKSEVLEALDGLMQESMSKGQGGAAPFGEDITLACAKYEQTHQISRPMLNAVQEWRREHKAATH